MFCLVRWKYIVKTLIIDRIKILIKFENSAQAYPFKPQVVCACSCVYVYVCILLPATMTTARSVDGHVRRKGRGY